MKTQIYPTSETANKVPVLLIVGVIAAAVIGYVIYTKLKNNGKEEN